MSNNFTGDITLRTPRPRSRRLRETGGTGGSVSASSQSSAVTDHNQLFGRDSENAHPANAITGLTDFMAAMNEMFELEGAGTSASPYVIKAKHDTYTNDSLAAATIYLPHNGTLDRAYDIEVDTSAISAEVPSGSGGGTTVYWTANSISAQSAILNAPEGVSGQNRAVTLSVAGHTHPKSEITDFPTLAAVATSGNYADLSNRPTIPVVPTNVSAFTNDAGYLTGITKAMVENVLTGTITTHKHNYADINNTPSSLPASDVYSWAKQSTKPSYTTTEVSEGNNLYFTDARARSAVDNGTYLKLSGGTMTATLIIASGNDGKIILNNTDSENKYQQIVFQQNGIEYGRLGTYFDNNLKYNSYLIYHSGNCNNTSTPWNVSTLVAGSAVCSNVFRNGYAQWMIGVIEGTSDIAIGTTAVQHKIGFYTSSGEVMTINNVGNVGIGTTSPAELLHIKSTSTNVLVLCEGITGRDAGLRAKGSTYELRFQIGSGGVNRGIYDINNSSWMIYRDSTTNVLIPQGNVGIGTTSPSQKLTVNGGVCMNTLYLPLNNTMSTAYSLQVNTSAIVAEIPS